MDFNRRLAQAGLLVSTLCLVACASGSADDGDSGSSSSGNSSPIVSNTEGSSSSSGSVQRFSTNCGTHVGGVLVNPATSENAQLVRVVSVAGSNLVIVQPTDGSTGSILVKLHGVGTAVVREAQVLENLRRIAQGQAYFIPAQTVGASTEAGTRTCVVNVPGGVATAGQLFTLDGRSYAEELFSSGASGEVDSGGSCGESDLAICYSQLREANLERSAGEIRDFLWKPDSESENNAGKPVILVDPCNATVFVNGQQVTDFGPSNGRCNTSRLFGACGSYGSNIRVEVFDNDSGLPYFNGSEPFVTVPNGCSRFEFVR